MISGVTDDEALNPVSAAERAARFSQTAAAFLLTGEDSQDIAYQLERKLFDNGHATVVLDTPNAALSIQAVKNAGLICICINSDSDSMDHSFDTDKQSIDEIYALLKEQKIIY